MDWALADRQGRASAAMYLDEIEARSRQVESKAGREQGKTKTMAR